MNMPVGRKGAAHDMGFSDVAHHPEESHRRPSRSPAVFYYGASPPEKPPSEAVTDLDAFTEGVVAFAGTRGVLTPEAAKAYEDWKRLQRAEDRIRLLKLLAIAAEGKREPSVTPCNPG
jgi:hypothetical protein